MDNQSKLIDDLFKEELGNYAETPPPMAWDALERRLEKAPPRGSFFSSRKTLYLLMAGTLLLLSISVARKLNLTSFRENKSENNFAMADNANTIAKSSPVTTNNIIDNSKTVTDNKKSADLNITSPAQAAPAAYKSDAVKTNFKNNNSNNYIRTKNRPGHRHTSPSGIANINADYNTDRKVDGRKIEKPENNFAIQPEQTRSNFNTNNAEKSLNEPGNEDLAGNNSATPDKTDQPLKDEIKPEPKPEPKSAPKPKAHFARIETGIKAGYESGFDNDGAKKWLIAPYFQYNLSPRFAVMLQPAVKSATLQSRNLGTASSYIKPYNEQPDVVFDPIPVIIPVFNDTFSKWHVTYHQKYDSIRKSHSMGGSYAEYELPILLKYKLSGSFAVYGGVNMVYSQLQTVKEHTYQQTITHDSTREQLTAYLASAPDPQFSTSQIFPQKGTDIKYYNNPYNTPSGNLLHIGYMLGFTYQYNNRWLMDGLIQQAPAQSNKQEGIDINKALSSAYFRFTLGYKLTK